MVNGIVMLLHNEKKVRLKKKEEQARLRRLVELAHRLDPRIRKEKRKVEKEREALKQAKAEKKRLAAIEKERLRQVEQAKKEALLKAQQDEVRRNKKQRKDMKKLRSMLRKVFKTQKVPGVNQVSVELILSELSLDILQALAKLAKPYPDKTRNLTVDEKQALANAWLVEENKYKAAKAEARARTEEHKAKRKMELRRAAEEEKKRKCQPWSLKEQSMLAKGVQRFPGGTPK